jgi:hypothetical protein
LLILIEVINVQARHFQIKHVFLVETILLKQLNMVETTLEAG